MSSQSSNYALLKKKHDLCQKEIDARRKQNTKNKSVQESLHELTPEERKKASISALLVSLLFLLGTAYIFLTQGWNDFTSAIFWIGLLVFGVNAFWLSRTFSHHFLLPYTIVMIKTKKFIVTIQNLAHHANWLEKVAFIGLFFGFGLAYVDYWKARKLGGVKRILLLGIFAIFFGLFFYFVLGILFSVPAMQPIFLISLIGFVLLGFGGLSLAVLIGYGVLSVISLFSGTQICPSIAPVIPGVPIPGLGITIPAIAWISLGMILVIHELSHGIMMAYYKKKIKSVGLLLAGIFPMGAFVEQDDKQFDNSKDNEQLMMLSAGPASNFFTMIIGIVFLLLLGVLITPISPIFENESAKLYSGVQVAGVEKTISFCGTTKDAPALGKFEVGDKVLAVNGTDINGLLILNKSFLESGNDMNILVERNDKNIIVPVTAVVFEDLNLKRIGLQFALINTGYEPPIWYYPGLWFINSISLIITFFILLSFAVGMFNYMPSDPLDGGKIAKIVLEPYAGFMKFKNKNETRKFIGRLFAWIFLITLLLNLLPYIGIFF